MSSGKTSSNTGRIIIYLSCMSVGCGLMLTTGSASWIIIACSVSSIALVAIVMRRRRDQSRPGIAHASPAVQEAPDESKTRAIEFVASVSHEIRTPLMAILGMAEHLQLPDLSDDQRQVATRTIASAGRHLQAILNDTLDYARLSAARVQVNEVACLLRGIISDVETILREQARSKSIGLRIRLEGDLPEWIVTDATRLRQILLNLVGNAVKFTQRGYVELRISRSEPESSATPGRMAPAEHLSFEISDTGPGLTERQIAVLFNPFEQAGAEKSRELGGTGLGLVISRGLARLLGGDITVRSREEVGTTFLLMLPLREAAPETVGSNLLSRHARGEGPRNLTLPDDDQRQLLAGCRILLVEDLPENQRLLAFILNRAGASVEVAADGKRAVELIAAGDPIEEAARTRKGFDIVLMDLQMPRMDGLEATTLLRRIGFAGPIVALTGRSSDEDRRRCIEAGCDEFLIKPIDRRKLIECVARWAGEACSRAAPHQLTNLSK